MNISNLFSDEKIKSKETMFKNTKTKPSPALTQGKKFKKFQNKIENSLEKKAKLLSGKEGFSDMDLTQETQNVIQQNNYSNQQQNIDSLRQQYKSTLQEYENLIKQINGNINGYVERVSPDNPYLNKVVSFSNGAICYVTNQGVVKWIPTMEIWNSLSISQTVQVNLNIPWLTSYNTPGTQIPTKPPLVSGTKVVSGQSFGNEGSNVFVDQLLPQNLNPSYLGCYAANSDNNNMTFIGGSPPPLNGAQIQNGNFSQPVLKNNSYIGYWGTASAVPGWYFNATLVNNSSAWHFSIPYPGGNQCVSIQNTNYIYCTLNLSVGVDYTITFSACSRNCCNSTNVGNPIILQIFPSSGGPVVSVIANFTPSPVNTWQNYSYTFTVPTTQSYNLYFSGTNTNGDQSTAISNVALNSSSISSGSYSYQDCEQAAINSGYQYFGLQNVNTQTGLGYCAVSNSEPAITQYGVSMIPSKQVPLWSSKTSKQSGNSAILSVTGSLQVINSNGQAVYSSPSTSANPPNYLGCYGDKSTRAMSMYNNGSQSYDLSGCQQVAQQKGYQYFALQNSSSGKNAQCFLSNNISQSMEYGAATNCTQISDGSWSGGGWSNAIYNAVNPQSNYFLILQDDGNMCIYRGTGPSDNQGFIWATNTTNQQQAANPNMTANNGINGQNWIASGTTLAAGDFIGSTNGNLALVMQTNGNLVLYTYQMETNCQKTTSGYMGGGVGGNAVYNIGMTSITGNMGKLAYIDGDSNLYTYSSTNQQYTNTYTNTIQNLDTPGNDIQGASFGNASVESCQTACNNNPDCAGFVFNDSSNYCYPKTNGMYPFGGQTKSDTNTTIYVRGIQPSSPPLGVSQNTNNTNSITYQNYIDKGPIGSEYGLANATSSQKQQLQQLQSTMNLLSNSISELTTNFQTGAISAESQSNKNVVGIQEYLNDINNTNVKIDDVAGQTTGNIQNILNDSDIVVLQKNYNYLLWSILAAGTVLISMNIVKKH
jgi:hypothetical protein